MKLDTLGLAIVGGLPSSPDFFSFRARVFCGWVWTRRERIGRRGETFLEALDARADWKP
jgi:hypothetical protein